jgi:hypothetical protein
MQCHITDDNFDIQPFKGKQNLMFLCDIIDKNILLLFFLLNWDIKLNVKANLFFIAVNI